MYITTRSSLWLDVHSAEQIDRTGYRYAVTANGTPTTAFRTKAALMAWLDLTGVSLTEEIVDDKPRWTRLEGAYREVMTFDVAAFKALEGFRYRAMSNGRYTLGIAVADDDGITTLWTMNPNAGRPTFDYRQSQNAIDDGNIAAPAVADDAWTTYDPLMTHPA